MWTWKNTHVRYEVNKFSLHEIEDVVVIFVELDSIISKIQTIFLLEEEIVFSIGIYFDFWVILNYIL